MTGGTLPAGAGILARADGASIAYRRTPGRGPWVVFLHGFHSDMNGSKAVAFEDYCIRRGQAFLRFDAFGHGASSGDILDGTIGRWADDAEAVITELTDGPVILVGSSFGGWIGLLAALRLRNRVAGFMGIAAAPDFTEDLMWADFTPEQRRELMVGGRVALPNCYEPEKPWIVPRLFIEEGRNHLLLRDVINLFCPIRLVQGMKDDDVPWETAMKLADALQSADVDILLIKDGDHRLSRDEDVLRLTGVLEGLLERACKR